MEECTHPNTVQILGPVYKCTECGEVYHDTNKPGIDAEHYQRLQRQRDAIKRAAIRANRPPNRRD